MRHYLPIAGILLCMLAVSCTPSNNEVKTIKATSKMVNIRDGERFFENAWTISPDIQPDVYSSENATKKVTFYTDIDSIVFDVEPDRTYDFIILLNETDTAWTQIQMEPSKLQILKKAAAYNLNDERQVPAWTYLPAEDPYLKKLRKEFNLDQVAGDGDEISQIKNLLYWVHDAVRHDGNSYNPESKNAIDLINICKEEDRGVNCRMMATILNECYLAMGFKSRFVTCMPRETEFDDCHVINIVYSKELDKWVWMDPTFAAYVTDDKGTLLSIEEVRESLINDQPLVLNPDANWNHEQPQTKEYYLDMYMAKNLYRFSIPAYSGYDVETWKKDSTIDYIELLPLAGIQQEPQKNIFKDDKINRIRTTYKTNNPAVYWAKPE